MNRKIAKLFKKASEMMSKNPAEVKRIYKYLKKTYEKEPNAVSQLERFIAEKQALYILEQSKEDTTNA